jgi:hypothetical protein
MLNNYLHVFNWHITSGSMIVLIDTISIQQSTSMKSCIV